MESILPTNGRITIIDNEINDVLPLMKIFAEKQLPYTYIKGDDIAYFPESPIRNTRILFLDLNLVGNHTASEKDVKSTLISVLRRVISPDNYPYILVYWSKQETDYAKIVELLFNEELVDIAPIRLVPFIKSDFFNLAGEELETEKIITNELSEIITEYIPYGYILNWENVILDSTDKVLQEVFHGYNNPESWNNNAEYILEVLGQAYLGKHYQSADVVAKINASYNSFNSIFFDTIENSIMKNDLDLGGLESSIDKDGQAIINANINKRINISNCTTFIDEPGAVLNFEDIEMYQYKQLLNGVLSISHITNEIKRDNPDMSDTDTKKALKQRCSDLRKMVCESWSNVGIIVTPSCDYAQKKKVYDRIVLGVIINAEYSNYIDNRSDAIFISPMFEYNGNNCIIVLDFRYLITRDLNNDFNYPDKIIFKVRQQLLSEIQSKLSRHISRQGFLSL